MRLLIRIGILALLLGLFLEVLLQAHYFLTVGSPLFLRYGGVFEYEPDEERCYRLKPDMELDFNTNEFSTKVYTNSLGLRTDASKRTVPYEKAEDVYRVLLLGPSPAMGWGSEYEEAFGVRIAQGLKVPGRRVELVNLGTPSQGPAFQICWVKKEAARYDFDLVLQTIYGNDLGPFPRRCEEPLQCILEGGHLYTVYPTLTRRVTEGAKNFAVVFYGYYLYHALTGTPASRDAPVMGKELFEEKGSGANDDDEEIADSLVAYADYVKSALGEETEIVFIHVPVAFMVHAEDVARWRHVIAADPEAERARLWAQVAAAHRRGLHVVDASEAMIEAGRKERMYFWLDTHMTPAGNRVIAEEAIPVVQRLVSEGSTQIGRVSP